MTAKQDSKRFAFGKNWIGFLKVLNEERIAEAEKSLKAMLGMDSLAGLTFLDVGSGSGLFSLAARRLGAKVLSFDYDLDSVACTRALQEKYYPDDKPTSWQIEQGSAIDGDYLSALGRFDIVYAWGVLHHTGDMWKALERMVSCVKPGGMLFIAIYNDDGWRSARHLKVTRFYVHLPDGLKPFMAGGYIAWEVARGLAADILRLRNPTRRYRDKIKSRGMSAWHDMIDWLGGYPFEVATPEAIVDFYKRHGFQLEKLKTARTARGCNQYVFCNSHQSAQAGMNVR